MKINTLWLCCHITVLPTQLRKKLALLKREYLRTAQRLQVRITLSLHFQQRSVSSLCLTHILICSQRAERSEAVRKHVRSRIAQQNHQDQTNPEVTSNRDDTSSVTLDAQNGTTSDVPLCQGPTEGESVHISCKVQVFNLFHSHLIARQRWKFMFLFYFPGVVIHCALYWCTGFEHDYNCKITAFVCVLVSCWEISRQVVQRGGGGCWQFRSSFWRLILNSFVNMGPLFITEGTTHLL